MLGRSSGKIEERNHKNVFQLLSFENLDIEMLSVRYLKKYLSYLIETWSTLNLRKHIDNSFWAGFLVTRPANLSTFWRLFKAEDRT